MQAEGVTFRTSVLVGELGGAQITNWASDAVEPKQLVTDFDAVILAGGAEQPRDLPVPGRQLNGVHFAMDFLPVQNKLVAGDKVSGQIVAKGKHVIVIGGGDTGSDCVGTSNRHGAKSVTQWELLPQPPESENKPLTWPYWPLKLRTSSSHEEGVQRDWAIATKAFKGNAAGNVTALIAVRVQWQTDPSRGSRRWLKLRGPNSRCLPTWCYWRWALLHPLLPFSMVSASPRMRAATPEPPWTGSAATRPVSTRYSLRGTCGVANH